MDRFLCRLLNKPKYDLIQKWISSEKHFCINEILRYKKFCKKIYSEYSIDEIEGLLAKKENSIFSLVEDYGDFCIDNQLENNPFYYFKEFNFSNERIVQFIIKHYNKKEYPLFSKIEDSLKVNGFVCEYLARKKYGKNFDFEDVYSNYYYKLGESFKILIEHKLEPNFDEKFDSSNKRYEDVLNALKLFSVFNNSYDTEKFHEVFLSTNISPFMNEELFPLFISLMRKISSSFKSTTFDRIDSMSEELVGKLKRYSEKFIALSCKFYDKNNPSTLMDYLIDNLNNNFYIRWTLLSNDKELARLFREDSNNKMQYQFVYLFKEYHEELLKLENTKELCRFFTGHDKRVIYKYFMQEAFRDGKVNNLFLQNCLLFKSFELSHDDFYKAVKETYKKEELLYSRNFKENYKEFGELYKLIGKYYTLDKFINYVNENHQCLDIFLNDTVAMVKKGVDADVDFVQKLKDRCKKLNIAAIHDYSNRILLEMGLCEKTLEQKEICEILNEKEIFVEPEDFCEYDNIPSDFKRGKSFKLFVPLTGEELVSIGRDMNICVGTANYDGMINNGECFIIALKFGDSFQYCIELRRNQRNNKVRFGQTKGKSNHEMPTNIKRKLESLLVDEKMMVESWRLEEIEVSEGDSWENTHKEIMIPEDAYFMAIGGYEDYLFKGVIKFLVNPKREYEKRFYFIGMESPEWWSHEEDTVMVLDSYNKMLFIQGKLNYREENIHGKVG